jgi:pyridoxal phosphate enzyme (YggS family)
MTTDTAANAVQGVRARLADVKAKIAAAALDAGRDPTSVGLVAVAKTHGAERIRPVLDDGQRLFGENRLQEAEEKWLPLRIEYPDVRLHLLGPLQRNKARRAVRAFDVIETLDREELASALARVCAEEERWPALFVQVNTGEEPQKAGVPPEDVEAFVARCRDEHRLPVRGLMCIPPIDEEPALHFALLAQIAQRCGLSELSMGMSADFEAAIGFGATFVRLGTAIFGDREAGPAHG